MDEISREAARRAMEKLNAWVSRALKEATLEVAQEQADLKSVEENARKLMERAQAQKEGLTISEWINARMNAAVRSYDSHGNNSVRELVKALRAIAEGYPVTHHDDRFITVENPDYSPDVSDPYLVIDVAQIAAMFSRY